MTIGYNDEHWDVLNPSVKITVILYNSKKNPWRIEEKSKIFDYYLEHVQLRRACSFKGRGTGGGLSPLAFWRRSFLNLHIKGWNENKEMNSEQVYYAFPFHELGFSQFWNFFFILLVKCFVCHPLLHFQKRCYVLVCLTQCEFIRNYNLNKAFNLNQLQYYIFV